MSQVPSKVAHNFWENLFKDIREVMAEVYPDVAEVGAMASGSARLTPRGEAYDANAELLPVLSLYPPVAGNPVLVARLEDGSEIVLGAIATGAEPAPISQAEASGLYMPIAGNGYSVRGDANFATGATASSNNSQSTYAVALSATVSGFEPGTYRVIAWGGFIANHSAANGDADLRLRADGTNTVNGTTKSIRVHNTANTNMAVHAADAIGGVTRDSTGSITVTLDYRAGTAGTVSARNAWVAFYAYRTA